MNVCIFNCPDLMWLTENDADQSSEGETAPKLRRSYTNSTNDNEHRADAQPISIEYQTA